MQDFVIVFFLRASFATANTLLTALKQPLDGSGDLISSNDPDSPYTGLLEAAPPPQIQLNLQNTKKSAGVKPDGLVAVVGARCCGRRKNHSSTGVAKMDCMTGACSPPFTPREKLFCIISSTWPSLHRWFFHQASLSRMCANMFYYLICFWSYYVQNYLVNVKENSSFVHSVQVYLYCPSGWLYIYVQFVHVC